MTYLISSLAIRTGISPRELLEMDPSFLHGMIQVLKDQEKAEKDARARTR